MPSIPVLFLGLSGSDDQNMWHGNHTDFYRVYVPGVHFVPANSSAV